MKKRNYDATRALGDITIIAFVLYYVRGGQNITDMLNAVFFAGAVVFIVRRTREFVPKHKMIASIILSTIIIAALCPIQNFINGSQECEQVPHFFETIVAVVWAALAECKNIGIHGGLTCDDDEGLSRDPRGPGAGGPGGIPD